MRTFKANLTNLKSQLQSSLPDGADIFGYSGVSKEALCTAIDTARALSEEIKPSDESLFPVISLKRAGKGSYDKLKSILDTQDDGKKKKRFDEFLDSLAYLLEKTKITYFIVAKDGLRNDVELADIRKRITELTSLEASLLAKNTELTGKIETLTAPIEEISKRYEEAKTQTSEIATWHKNADTQTDEIADSHTKIEGWDEEIGANAAKFESLKNKIVTLGSECETLKIKMQEYEKFSKEVRSAIIKSQEDQVAYTKEISLLLGDANRASMAASFLLRKEELITPQKIWQRTFLGAIIGLLVVVGAFIVPSLLAGKPVEVLGELALISPLVWLGWFAAKQYSYTSRIQEDYAFKAAAAMAYEGHKNAAREVDAELEGVLLEFSLYNLAQNPIRLYGGLEIHGSPWSEYMGQAVGKLCRLSNIKAGIPSVGNVEASFEPGNSKTELAEK